MDHGSYSRPDGRGQPTLSGSSAANNGYQVNVSRQKTKKWVEAKSQNYDGDDWGADEYDDDEVEPPLPLAPQGPQYGGPHTGHNVPSLHIQTNQPPPQQHQPYPPPQSRPPPPASTQPRQASNNPSSAHPSSAVPQSAGGFQPQSASSTYPLSPRSPPDSLPSQTPQVANKPLPLVRPSDIYRRMEEEKGRASSDSSRPSADMGSNLSKHSSASPARTAAEPVKPQPPIVPVPAPRTDSHSNVYQNLTKAPVNQPTHQSAQQPSFASPPRSDVPVSQFATPPRDTSGNEAIQDAKRLSTSPKLPDLARMSVFGADFFSTGGFTSSLSSQQIAEQDIPEVPKVAPELKVDSPTTHKANASPADAAKPSSNKIEAPPAAPTAIENASIQHEIIAPTVYQTPGPAPTATDSMASATLPRDAPQPAADPAKQATTRTSIDTASSSRSAASAADITPTKPLNVRKEESPVRAFEPPPSLQREPTFGTDTSSPVKESDMLRDEIIKTLNSPGQPSKGTFETGPTDTDRKGSQSQARDSTYTLQDYDSYWDDTDTAPEVPAQPVQPQPKTMSVVPEEAAEAVVAAEAKAPEPPAKTTEPTLSVEETKPAMASPPAPSMAAVQPTSQAATSQHSSSPAVSQVSQATSAQQPPEASIVSPTSTDRRRRFSWEAEDASRPPPTALGVAPPTTTAPPPVPTAAATVPASTLASAPAPALTTTVAPPTETKPLPELTSPRDGQSGPTTVPTGATAVAATGAAVVVAAGVTAATANNHGQESKRLSLADEKGLSATTSNEISSPTEEHPALRLSDPAPAPVLSMPRSSGTTMTPFKDIMGLNNSSERVAKFNETRVAFAVMDTGLDRWLTNLHQDHPEHHSKSFNSYHPSAAPPTGAAPGAPAPTQQPYYQQYLNASTPGSGSGSSPGGRRIGGLTMPSTAGGSAFGHSSNQIGTKGKELMQSAGKMGKGLFSKGKNKLRGDKGDTPPPQVPTKAKHDRSGSWAVLSSKLRTEFSSSKEQHEQHQQPQPHNDDYYAASAAAPRASMTIAPQIPIPEPVSPLLREATPDRSFASASAAQTASGQRSSDYHQAAGAAISAPLTFASNASNAANQRQQIRVVPSETAHGPAGMGAPSFPPPAAEDSGVGMLAQPDESAGSPQRQSSFVGLPPIRRSSTFGMKSKARRAAERFPLDEEDGNGVPGLPTSEVMEDPVSQQQPEAPQQQVRRDHLSAAHAGPSYQTTTDKDGIVVHHQPVSAEHSPERPAAQPAMAPQPPSQPQPMRPNNQLPPLPPVMMHPGQSGPWRLEESHLTEPLHQAKNRSGHSPISPSFNYGFDKETGQPVAAAAAMPPPPLPAGSSNNSMRARNTDVPPSSAQRYPGLFAPRPDEELPPQQQQRQVSSQAYYEEMANPRHSGNEYSIPGVGPPTDDPRGRAKRNSGIFREIGDKISRATSRDRKNSFADSRPPVDATIAHADEASESSFGTEDMQDRKKKRRSSFLHSLTGRASMDQGSRQSFSMLQRSQTETFPQSSSEDVSTTARKRSMFGGVMAGLKGSSANANANAPTSGLANQQSADEPPQLTPKKKRFSAITKAFQRPNQDRPSSGMSLEATESVGSSNHPPRAGGLMASMPFRNRERSDSSTQMYPAAGVENNRRASFSNLLSSITGNRGQTPEQPPKNTSGFGAPRDFPQDIPSPPRQRHAADDFPTPNPHAAPAHAPAPSLPAQFMEHPQPLFAAGENTWGVDRPQTSTTVTGSERPITDAGESIASSPAIGPAAAAVETSTKRDNPIAPSDVSDSETDMFDNARKPSDVAPSVMTASAGADEEGSADMTRQDTNVSQATPSIVTDLPRQDDQQQSTPTGPTQYPNSPGGYFAHNDRMASAGAPLSAGAQQGYAQGPPMHHQQQDPRRSFTGPAYGQSMGQQQHYGGQHGQQPMQYPNQQQHLQQQQQQQYMQSGFGQPAQPAEQSASSGKGWRGLKSKMAGMAGPSSPSSKNQDKSAARSSKLLKRLSKQPGPTTTQAAQSGETSPGFSVFPGNQSQPMAGPPQQMPPHMQHQQLPPQQQMVPQQMHMGQGFHPQQGHPPQQLSMYMQQQQQQQQQQGEPRYANVPVPQGYNAYGQGGGSQAPVYNVSRQYSQHQTPYQQQQQYANHYQQQYGHPQQHQQPQQQHNGFHQTSPAEVRRESQSHEPLSQQVSQTGSELLSPVTQRSGSLPMLSPTSDEPRRPSMMSPTSDEPPHSPHTAPLTREALAQQDASKDMQPVQHLHPDEGRPSLGPSNSNRVSQVSVDSGRQRPSPKSQQSPAVSHKQLQTAAVTSAPTDNERHVSAASISPPVGPSPDLASATAASTTAAATAPIHTEPILSPATPAAAEPLTKHLTGDSDGHVSDDSLEKKTKAAKTETEPKEAGHFAELEDTADARQRTIRIDGQEEKILYDPEEENPKMSATSYPGQEWNPYGEPGFGEWPE